MLKSIGNGLTLKAINRVIRVLIISNFFLNSAWGFIGPIFAIFILEKIAVENIGQAAEIAGFAALVYWVVKSLLQIPISDYFDKKKGERDDYWFMVLGLFVAGLVPFGFLFAFLPWHVYLLQMVHALGMALFIPSWNAIFTRHIDKGREAYEWALDSTFLGLGAGITGAIGGVIAATVGFKWVFIFVGILTFVSALLLFLIYSNILPRERFRIPRFRFPFINP